MAIAKNRADIILFEKGLAESRQRAKSLIMAGKVIVTNYPDLKPGTKIPLDSDIKIKEPDFPYVSRGALKLEKALKTLDIDVNNVVCLDIGASTGGFTDCLLQCGAKRVYSVDVGYGQLAWKLRQDDRVVVMERTNIRHLEKERIPDLINLVTIDTSFISLKIVIPSVLKFMGQNAIILALIKPQFEVGKGKVGKGGVVRDPEVRNEVIEDLTCFFAGLNLKRKGLVPSPVLGPKGNQEYIICLSG
jgi:23S rRNA (cytidine1920-2'-O)/16S rRNA (cytidine1409-2'-O)-methyltransferase